MRCRLPGPHDPAQTASLPVICASPAAANAATSSCRTWIQSILLRLRSASVTPFRLSPTTPKIRLTPAWASVSAIRSATLSIFILHDPFSASGEHRRTFFQEGVSPLHGVGAETDFCLRFDLAAELIGIAGVFAFVDQATRRDQRA